MEPQKSVVVIVGKRRSGKSTLIKDMLFKHRDMRKVVVMSGSEEATGFYHDLAIPKSFIRTRFDPVFLRKIYDIQVDNPDKPCLIIFDDLSFDNTMWKDPTISDMLYKGRHYGIGCIFAVQYVMHVPLALRNQVDYAFVFSDNNYKNQARIHDNFFAFVSKIEEFSKIFRHFTNNRGVLISNCVSNSSDPRECMHWYRSTIIEGLFHMGCDEYKRCYSKKQSVENYKIVSEPEIHKSIPQEKTPPHHESHHNKQRSVENNNDRHRHSHHHHRRRSRSRYRSRSRSPSHNKQPTGVDASY
jgi:hypothetical protein